MTIRIPTLIEMPPPKEIRAGIEVRVSDGVRMKKVMKLYKSVFVQTEKNKMSKIWESENPVIFVFRYMDETWEMPINRVHYFCSYWQKEKPEEWWISLRENN